VIAMLNKWAKCSSVALNEAMLTTAVNYSQSYPQKLWSDASGNNILDSSTPIIQLCG